MSRHPEIKWAQREEKVYITVVLADTKDAKVQLSPDGVFSFSATAGQQAYDLKLELADKVNVNEINIGERRIFCILEKAEPEWWNKLLKGDAKTPHYVKVDWDKWVDEDDDAGPAFDDVGGLDFSQFGYKRDMRGYICDDEDMGGMGGMGMQKEIHDDEDSDNEEMAGIKDIHDDEDSDYEEMGGMGGMGMQKEMRDMKKTTMMKTRSRNKAGATIKEAPEEKTEVANGSWNLWMGSGLHHI